MGLLDQVLGSVLGSSGRSGGANSPLMSILMALLSQRGGGTSGGGLGDLLGGLTGGGIGSGRIDPSRGGSAGGGLAGGVGGLLEQFTRSGHGDVANSWVGSGPNRPIAPHQLEEVLGGGTIDGLSQQTGMRRVDLLSELSAMLPHAVDQLTPQGRLPSPDEMKHW